MNKFFGKMTNVIFTVLSLLFIAVLPSALLGNSLSIESKILVFSLDFMIFTLLLNTYYTGIIFDKIFLKKILSADPLDLGLFNLSVFSDKLLMHVKMARAGYYARCVVTYALKKKPRSMMEEHIFKNEEFKSKQSVFIICIAFSFYLSFVLLLLSGIPLLFS